MNLALILSVLTLVSGIVVAFNRFYYQKRLEASGSSGNASLNILIEYSRSFFPVLLIVLVIRSFVFEPFRIPSGSMIPTLTQGDYIFVKKYSYGLRWPVIERKFFETGHPERGDVVVFRLPSDPSINYIKRVVGLPGDTIGYRDHQVIVNGVPMPITREGEVDGNDLGMVYVEELDGRKHEIRISRPSSKATERTYTVSEGHYFMMGDNRDNSQDSRFIGEIPETHLVGKAVRIWMHMDGLEWPDWGRIGTKIE